MRTGCLNCITRQANISRRQCTFKLIDSIGLSRLVIAGLKRQLRKAEPAALLPPCAEKRRFAGRFALLMFTTGHFSRPCSACLQTRFDSKFEAVPRLCL